MNFDLRIFDIRFQIAHIFPSHGAPDSANKSPILSNLPKLMGLRQLSEFPISRKHHDQKENYKLQLLGEGECLRRYDPEPKYSQAPASLLSVCQYHKVFGSRFGVSRYCLYARTIPNLFRWDYRRAQNQRRGVAVKPPAPLPELCSRCLDL